MRHCIAHVVSDDGSQKAARFLAPIGIQYAKRESADLLASHTLSGCKIEPSVRSKTNAFEPAIVVEASTIPGYDSFSMPTIPLSCIKQVAGKLNARPLPVVPRPGKDQSRNTRAGSVRIARQAGRRQAATEVIVITATADANASGSFGLTW